MESKILDCAQEIFDAVEGVDVSHQPNSLTEISSIMGRFIWLSNQQIAGSDKRYVSDDLACLLETMTGCEIQSAHVLVYGNRHSRSDVIPF